MKDKTKPNKIISKCVLIAFGVIIILLLIGLFGLLSKIDPLALVDNGEEQTENNESEQLEEEEDFNAFSFIMDVPWLSIAIGILVAKFFFGGRFRRR